MYVVMDRPETLKDAKYDPHHPPLDKDDLSAAKEQLIKKVPHITRRRMDPPLINQVVGNVSFLLLDKPQDGVVGFFKNRGNWPNEKTAEEEAESLIMNHDSAFTIYQFPVGGWVPITTNEKYAQQTSDIDISGNIDDKMRSAQKEKKQKDQKIMREIKERMDMAVDDDCDPYSNTEGIDYYTMRRWGEIQLKQHIVKAQLAVQGYQRSLEKMKAEIKELNKKNPIYTGTWVDHMNVTRKERGLPDYVPPGKGKEKAVNVEVKDDDSDAGSA